MELLKKTLKELFRLLQISLILTYISLEEVVWERFAQPIYRYIKYLKPFEKLEQLLAKSNRYVVLLIFIISLVVGEGFGLLSPIVAIWGYPFLAIVVYGLKLVVVAFAFWVFNTQKELLLSFKWLNYLYKKILAIIDWIKATQVYKDVVSRVKKIKLYIKVKYIEIKNYIANRFWR